MKMKIPVGRPLLPDYSKLEKYIKEIDLNRYYSNFGPLLNKFEQRVSETISGKPGHIVTASSGTKALELIFKALDLPSGAIVFCPAFTFISSALSIRNVNLEPHFVDVDPNTWAITPDNIKNEIKKCGRHPAAILLVIPFGSKFDIKPWEKFKENFNIPIVIDAAASSIDDIPISAKIPIMVSLHATKMLNSAEGGLICSLNKSFLLKIKRLSNFGFYNNLPINLNGTNGKLSEYHACVGLASLDEWQQTKVQLRIRAQRYVQKIKNENISFLKGYGYDWSGSTCLINGPPNLDTYLHKQSIETRKWWRLGCHKEEIFRTSNQNLPNTDRVAKTYLGIPMHKDLSLDLIDFIAEKINNFS